MSKPIRERAERALEVNREPGNDYYVWIDDETGVVKQLCQGSSPRKCKAVYHFDEELLKLVLYDTISVCGRMQTFNERGQKVEWTARRVREEEATRLIALVMKEAKESVG